MLHYGFWLKWYKCRLYIKLYNFYDGLRDVRKQTKNDRIVNIDKEKYEIYSLHVNSCYVNMQGNVCCTAFEKSIQKNYTYYKHVLAYVCYYSFWNEILMIHVVFFKVTNMF
jgi:hypothetical protein